MKECGSLEKVLAKLEEDNKSTTKKKKYTIPSPYPYEDARELFKKPVVFQDIDKLEVNILHFQTSLFPKRNKLDLQY